MKINQRKDGYFYCSKMVNGKRYQFVGKSKEDVRKQVVNLEHDIINGNILQTNSYNIKRWSYEWLNTYKKNVAPATYAMYKQVIDLYIIPNIGNIQLKNLKESDIMNMLNNMGNITRKKDVTLLTIKQILNKAVSNNLIYKNVATEIKLKKHVATEKTPISDEYIRILSNNVEKKCCLLCLFLVYTGLRREEIVPLTYEDIDFKNKTIKVDKAITFINNQPVLKKTKNECERIIPLPDALESILRQKNTGLIFFNQYGTMMSETSFKRQIDYANKIVQKNVANYTRFTAHQLRHTYACLLHKAGVPLKEAQYFMGHKDIKMLLNIYTHSDLDDKKKAQNILNNFIQKL